MSVEHFARAAVTSAMVGAFSFGVHRVLNPPRGVAPHAGWHRTVGWWLAAGATAGTVAGWVAAIWSVSPADDVTVIGVYGMYVGLAVGGVIGLLRAASQS